MAEEEPSQLLVIRLGSIGDVLLATPLVRALRRRYPRTRLGFLTKAANAPLLEGNPHLDRVLVWPESSGEREPRRASSTAGPWSTAALGLARELSACRPLWLLDLQSSPRTLAWGSRVRADRRFRYKKDYVRRALLVHAHVDRYPDPVPSVAERYFDAVRELGLEADRGGLDLRLSDDELERADRTLAGARGAGASGSGGGRAELDSSDDVGARRWLAVAAGARWATKRWPPEAFATAARDLAGRRDLDVVLLGSAEDASISRAVGGMLEDAGLAPLDLTGRLDLRDSAAVLSRAALLLANDSGLLHVASALRVPTVAVFGSTAPQLGFAPYRAPSRVLGVDGLACRPCTHVGRPACPLGHFRCMRELSPARAARAAEALLDERRSSATPPAARRGPRHD